MDMRFPLTDILLEVYAPGFKLEAFMSALTPSPSNANQHLPEKTFTCKDCGFSFPTAKDFSDHFERLKGEDGRPTLLVKRCQELRLA